MRRRFAVRHLIWRVLGRGIQQRQILRDYARVLENEAAAAANVAIHPGDTVEAIARNYVLLIVAIAAERAVGGLSPRRGQDGNRLARWVRARSGAHPDVLRGTGDPLLDNAYVRRRRAELGIRDQLGFDKLDHATARLD